MEVLRDASFWTGVSVGVGSCAALGLLCAFRPRIGNFLPLRWFSSTAVRFADRMLGRDTKMVFVVRTDCKMQKGKIAAQCCHAAVMAYKRSVEEESPFLKPWEMSGQPKIVCRVDSGEEMESVGSKARDLGLIVAVVRDAGRTQVVPGTRTVLGIGPGPIELINQCTSQLKLL
ncbi:peptidyl-tRNA hydrolase 2, mitochondrial [Galendromus occidentalis]|uniref:peptidyl-tRNA hydrolase n=1 Tax=Galendromus occidentalis TaxID=34638 RepID=A0AAJ6QVI5_9ACAR|nr:peptidyl-tRNA hydrolase 2, mitochondrial [Galendromus occidentalis]